MISSDLENINLTTSSSPQNHRFKPCFLHEAQVVEYGPRIFGKIYHKHVKSLTLNLEGEPLRRILMPKTLRSLKIWAWRLDKNLSLVKKIVKPYIKYLKDAQGKANQPKILKLLPLLKNLEVSPTRASLRILSLHAGFKQLYWRIDSSFRRDADEKTILMKYKVPLSRNLARIRGLKSISIEMPGKEAPVILFLEMIDQNLDLDQLEHFCLHIWENSNPQDLPEQKLNISKVLAKVTYLSARSPAWYSFLISSGKFTNLSSLNVKLLSKEFSWDSLGLFKFHDFPVLKKLFLELEADSPSAEKHFFENFTLPSSIEDLKLKFRGFSLSVLNDNNALSSQFFKRLQETKGVKALSLAGRENAENSIFNAKFACPLISCFENLETLFYASFQGKYFGSDEKSQPFHFESFWTAFIPSKETLRTISVYGDEIIFPEGAHHLETQFPKLQKLEVYGNIFVATEICRFSRKISSLTEVKLDLVKLRDEEKLKEFLSSMKDIPEGAGFELHLDVGDIKQKPLIACLKKYIEDVNVRGRLGMYFKGVQTDEGEDRDEDLNLFKIAKLAREKGCFDPFRMSNSEYYPLILVRKTELEDLDD